MIIIQVSWSENEIQLKNNSVGSCYVEALQELKKREVLSVGISESLTLAVQNLFMFLWTPVLLSSYDGPINIGFIFICLVSSIILGTKIFELSVIYMKTSLYVLLSTVLFCMFAAMGTIYLIPSFPVRVLLFSAFNGFAGVFQPLYSFIKYKILIEKHRTLLMNIFRIPLNAYVILVLLLLKYIDPMITCMIAACMSLAGFFIITSLIIIPPKGKDGQVVLNATNAQRKISDVSKLEISRLERERDSKIIN